eukprot:m.55917 g.55917  ORF g.55917 m.55917 type:complete len:877 (-) comp12565_c0_seq1:58-2688(-)
MAQMAGAAFRGLVVVVVLATIGAAVQQGDDPSSAPPTFVGAASDLVQRVLGSSALACQIALGALSTPTVGAGSDPSDTFRIACPSSQDAEAGIKVSITGTSGVALASGFAWYLKYTVHTDVLYGSLNLTSPVVLPDCNPTTTPTTIQSLVPNRYYFNVVTHSYSAAFWNWDRWQKEIDWMAMQGYNLPLAFTGQEYVWSRVYKEQFNLTQADLDEHFAGPAFLAWGRMGNIRGWGGWYDQSDITGLTQHWMEQQFELQKLIVQRQRSLGMRTVLPGFAGHVPLGLSRVYPTAKVSRSPSWCGFSGRYGQVGLLEAGDPLFVQIGKAFVQMQTELFGTDHVYNADTFNEMRPSSSSSSYVSGWGTAVFNAMQSADENAIWLVQGWSLHGWPTPELDAYFSKVPEGRLLVLDLGCASSSSSFSKFTKDINPPRPVICGLLSNMGGERALDFGTVSVLPNRTASNVVAAGTHHGQALLAGSGANPEAFEANPAKWHIMGEIGWRALDSNPFPALDTWLEGYIRRRYGGASANMTAAWALLVSGARQTSNFGNDGLARIPSLSPPYNPPKAAGNPAQVVEAWKLFIASADQLPHGGDVANPFSAAWRYDLVDVTRQALQNHFAGLFEQLQATWGDCSKLGNTFTAFNQSNCNGGADPKLRLPGCGMDTPYKKPCDINKTAAWCLAHGRSCAMFNTNGYLYAHADGTSPFHSYPLACYVRNQAFNATCGARLANVSAQILEVANDLETVLATDSHFLLGRWISDARQFGNTTAERDWLEFNARMQITLWGSVEANHAQIADYAGKQYSGLVSSFHLPLWTTFLDALQEGIRNNKAPNLNDLRQTLLQQAERWTNTTTPVFPTIPSGDPLAVARQLAIKYGG